MPSSEEALLRPPRVAPTNDGGGGDVLPSPPSPRNPHLGVQPTPQRRRRVPRVQRERRGRALRQEGGLASPHQSPSASSSSEPVFALGASLKAAGSTCTCPANDDKPDGGDAALVSPRADLCLGCLPEVGGLGVQPFRCRRVLGVRRGRALQREGGLVSLHQPPSASSPSEPTSALAASSKLTGSTCTRFGCRQRVPRANRSRAQRREGGLMSLHQPPQASSASGPVFALATSLKVASSTCGPR